jgi:hypothetical protein
MLALLCLGMARALVNSMFETIQRAKHHVSTAFGASKRSYGDTRAKPLQGACQGNGAGPAIWAVISTVIIAVMATHGHGFNIVSGLSGALVSFVCYAFVDDTNVIQSAATAATPGEVVIGEMLRATGGALVPSKSHWHAIDFRWTGAKCACRSTDEMPGEILIADVDGSRVALQRHKVTVGKETLVVMQAMDGVNADEILHLRNKAEDFAESMRTGMLSKNDAWFALTAAILKTMQHPMAATTMTEKEWNHVVAPVLRAGLPRACIDRNFPRDMLHGPECLQGFRIMHPWCDQEITHLLACLKQT